MFSSLFDYFGAVLALLFAVVIGGYIQGSSLFGNSAQTNEPPSTPLDSSARVGDAPQSVKTLTPTPSETPEGTGTIQATPTGTRTPRPSPTPTPGS